MHTKTRSPKEWFMLYLKGAAMGAADVIPGISGGTIAFITGIYPELVNTIASLSPKLVWQNKKIHQIWHAANGPFLATIILGLVTSFMMAAKGINWIINHQPLLVWSLFFGLIATSSFLLGKQVKAWGKGEICSLLIGLNLGYMATIASPSQIPFHGTSDYWMLIPAGAVSLCAMILPGISGSFLLLLMGMYQPLLTALIEKNHAFLVTFTAGGVLGLLAFSRYLRWLLKNHYEITLTFLTGIMLGALNKVWPWKITEALFVDSKGNERPLIQNSVLPVKYQEIIGNEPQIGLCILMMIIGTLLAAVPVIIRNSIYQTTSGR